MIYGAIHGLLDWFLPVVFGILLAKLGKFFLFKAGNAPEAFWPDSAPQPGGWGVPRAS